MKKKEKRRGAHVSSRAALALIVALSACDDTLGLNGVDNTDFVAEEPFSFQISAENQTQVRLEGVNGGVEVIGSAQATAFLIGGERIVRSESVADAEASLELLEVEVSDLGDELVIRTKQPRNTGGRTFVVNYQLTIPADADVRIVNINGGVAIDRTSGSVDVDNVNGSLRFVELDGSVRAETVNGGVIATMTMPGGSLCDLATTNGSIDLEIPRGSSAEFWATVTNGRITTSNLVFTDQTVTRTSLRGTLGDGDGGTIELRTVNGNIDVHGF